MAEGGSVIRDLNEVFRPDDGSWQPVSPRLATARRVVLGLTWLPVVAVAVVLVAVSETRRVGIVVAALVAAVFLWLWWLIGRRVRSFGYLERSDDLLVTSGILSRRLVIVPYGRMQLVDVRSGPIDRRLGVTTVQLHTAAATTDAAVPGLEPEVAAALRDRLATAGESRTAGL